MTEQAREWHPPLRTVVREGLVVTTQVCPFGFGDGVPPYSMVWRDRCPIWTRFWGPDTTPGGLAEAHAWIVDIVRTSDSDAALVERLKRRRP